MKNGKGGKRAYDDEDTEEEEEEPPKKKAKNGVKVCITRLMQRCSS
jgi:SWI/SNF-related matrix-associated actin-dependent regulator of chromatin subfamily A member 5